MFRQLFFLSAIVFVAVNQCKSEEENVSTPVRIGKIADAKDRLFKALFQNYNPEIIPDSPNLKFGVALVTTRLNEYDSSLDSNLWLRMVWNDPRLKWNEDEFGGVGVLRVSPSNLWIPDIRLYNAADTRHGDFASACDNTKVLIYPSGEVLWVPPCRFFSRCPNTLNQFPTAPQTCTLKFGSWTYDGLIFGMSLYNDKNEMDLSDFTDITEWKVLSAPAERHEKYYDCCKEPYIDLTFNVTLQRKPELTQSTTI